MKIGRVDICGISHEIERVLVIDESLEGVTQGKIVYSEAKILVKEGLPVNIMREVIIHEMLHGILNHIGQQELSCDENFIQALANGIYNSGLYLDIKEDKE